MLQHSLTKCVCVCQDSEVLEAETKRFKDLEDQQMERESHHNEEEETSTQHLLREIVDYQVSTVTRKVRCVCVRVCVCLTLCILNCVFPGEAGDPEEAGGPDYPAGSAREG